MDGVSHVLFFLTLVFFSRFYGLESVVKEARRQVCDGFEGNKREGEKRRERERKERGK